MQGFRIDLLVTLLDEVIISISRILSRKVRCYLDLKSVSIVLETVVIGTPCAERLDSPIYWKVPITALHTLLLDSTSRKTCARAQTSTNYWKVPIIVQSLYGAAHRIQ